MTKMHRIRGRRLEPGWAICAGLALSLSLVCLSAGSLRVAANAPAAATVPVAPDVTGATLSFMPAPVTLRGCETIPVEVWVRDISALYAADVRVTFDKDVLEVVDADPGSSGVQVQMGSFLSPDYVVSRDADNSAGVTRYALTQLAPTPPASGSGILFTILFRARSESTAAPLTFAQVELADRNGVVMSVAAVNSSVQTLAPGAPSLAIAKWNASDAALSWTAVPEVSGYYLFRETAPYLVPHDPAYQVVAGLGFHDAGALGNPSNNYYYVLESACATGFRSRASNRVGEFDFALVPGGG